MLEPDVACNIADFGVTLQAHTDVASHAVGTLIDALYRIDFLSSAGSDLNGIVTERLCNLFS